MAEKAFLHADLDAFFASVEQLENPALRGKPVIVGGIPGDRRAVVSTASYEARAFGVHSAMPIGRAARLCPQAVFLPGDMKKYAEKSQRVMEIFSRFSPDVQQISIDEAFIDLTGTERLFGNPEQTALKIRAAVKSETGLSVSIGMAANKYAAKMASKKAKPDGFFRVPAGGEAGFMAAQKLESVWGIGKKTLSRLNSAGIFSIPQILRLSVESLEKLLGEAGGKFLFSAVRGEDRGFFERDAKSRSISAERTFFDDLCDEFSVETALMKIAQELSFRMLREGAQSKTLSLKIRYSDFSTVSRQKTFSAKICGADDIFQKAKSLFDQKKRLEGGKIAPIRLLGISAQNLCGEIPENSLFESENKKKEAVEKAVFSIKEKFPDLKIGKARLLEGISGRKILSALLSLFFAANFARAQNSGADEKKIDLSIQGFWDASVKYAPNFRLSPNSSAQASSKIPVFSQKSDLLLTAFFDKKWFVEAAVADKFEDCSIAAGYKGEGVLKSARVGTRGVFFPQSYSLFSQSKSDEQNDVWQNNAPGASANLSGEKWRADFMLRYDRAKSCEKLFAGESEILSSAILANGFEQGKRFVLPDGAAQEISDVFVEAQKGEGADVRDSAGRKYRRLSSSEYLVLPAQNALVLSEGRSCRILAAFSNSAELKSRLGKFRTKTEGGEGFLGETESEFGASLPAEKRPFLSEFSRPRGEDFFAPISDGREALVLFEPGAFSPFEFCAFYKSFSGDVEAAYIIHLSTSCHAENFSAQITEDDSAFTADERERRNVLIEVFREDAKKSGASSPAKRFPFARENPQIYLQKDSGGCDLAVLAESYSRENRFEIGSSAIPGSVRVYRNGILTGNFDYVQSSGLIKMRFNVSPQDRIKITWQENSDSFQNGALSAAAGWGLKIMPSLDLDVAATGFWTFSPQKFNDENFSTPANASAAAGIKWENFGFSVKNVASAAVGIENAGGIYGLSEILGEKNSSQYLPSDAARKANRKIEPNLREFSLFLSKENRGEEDVGSIEEKGISGHIAAMRWKTKSAANSWAAMNVFLGNAASKIASAQKLEIAVKSSGIPPDARVFVQLGIDPDEDCERDSLDFLPCWEITGQIFDGAWRTVDIEISDSQRSKLRAFQGARIIVVANGEFAGSIFAGPFEATKSEYFVEAETGAKAFVRTKIQAGAPRVPHLKDGDENLAVEAEWEGGRKSESSFSLMTSEIPIFSYKSLKFCFCLPADENAWCDADFSLLLSRQEEFGEKKVLEAAVFEPKMKELADGAWHKVSVDLQKKKICVDGKTLAAGEGCAAIFGDDAPAKVAFKINGSKGKILLAAFYLEGNDIQSELSDSLSAGWQKEGAALKIGGFALLSSPKISGEGKVKRTAQGERRETSFSGEASASANIAGLDVAAAFFRDADETAAISGAEHSVALSRKKIGAEERFSFSDSGKSAEKRNSARLFLPFEKFSAETNFLASASRNGLYERQNFSNQTDFSAKIGEKSEFRLKFDFGAGQSAKKSGQNAKSEGQSAKSDADYGQAYREATVLQFSDGKRGAKSRETFFSISPALSLFGANFFPSAELSAATDAKNSAQHSIAGKTAFALRFPWRAGKSDFLIALGKSSSSQKEGDFAGKYADDAGRYFSDCGAAEFSLGEPFFYDLFDFSLGKKMKDSAKFSEKTACGTQYEFSWGRRLSGLWIDFFAPSKVRLQTARDVTATSAAVADIYTQNFSADWMAINAFGKFSAAKIFKFYEQDEFSQNLTLKLKFERENPAPKSWEATSANRACLYFSDENFLRTMIFFSIRERGRFDVQFDVLWSRSAKFSPFSALLSLCLAKVRTGGISLTRTDSVSYEAAKSDWLSQKVSATHEIEAQLGANITAAAKAALECSRLYDGGVEISPLLEISARLEY